MPTILALDFETANYAADSACQLAIVRLEDWKITRTDSWLIRPPTDEFVFTYLHGIAMEHVAGEKNWAQLWPLVAEQLKGVDFLAAHNAPFDRGVLNACCQAHGLAPPELPYLDTVGIARQVWKIFPTKLNLVCQQLNIALNHHEALSDARACAEILIQARQKGWQP